MGHGNKDPEYQGTAKQSTQLARNPTHIPVRIGGISLAAGTSTTRQTRALLGKGAHDQFRDYGSK
jgi:hypothetical protein